MHLDRINNNINAKYKALEKENRELKLKLRRAESERDILKKALWVQPVIATVIITLKS